MNGVEVHQSVSYTHLDVYKRQAQACPFSQSSRLITDLVELFEDTVAILRLNSLAGVGDGDLDQLVPQACVNQNFATSIGELRSIVCLLYTSRCV